MKKTFLAILLCDVMVLGLTGCSNTKTEELDDIHSFKGTIIECQQKSMVVRPNKNEEEYKSSDKFMVEYVDNFSSCSIGGKVKITYKGMINESYPAQIGTTNIEEIRDFDFYITKSEIHNAIRFNGYHIVDDRTIYLAGNIAEFYIREQEQDKDITLKTYLSMSSQRFDYELKHITDELELKSVLKDGGTKIYKSKDKDITMIVCNTIKGDRNILIGDYSMEYTEGDCKN